MRDRGRREGQRERNRVAERHKEQRGAGNGEARGTDGAGDRVATKSGRASQTDPNNISPPCAETWRDVGAALPVTMLRQGNDLAAAEDRLSLFQSKCLHFSMFICILTECQLRNPFTRLLTDWGKSRRLPSVPMLRTTSTLRQSAFAFFFFLFSHTAPDTTPDLSSVRAADPIRLAEEYPRTTATATTVSTVRRKTTALTTLIPTTSGPPSTVQRLRPAPMATSPVSPRVLATAIQVMGLAPTIPCLV
jgi:hypothetical protein